MFTVVVHDALSEEVHKIYRGLITHKAMKITLILN